MPTRFRGPRTTAAARFLAWAPLAALPATLAAQQTTARLGVGGGTVTDIRGVTSSAVTVAPSLVAQASPRTSVTLAGNGARFLDGGWSATALAAVAARTATAGWFDVAAELSGARTWTSFDAALTGGDAAVTAGVLAGPVELRAGGRAAAVDRVLPGAPIAGLPGVPTRPGAEDRRSASAYGPIVALAIRPIPTGATRLELGARAGAWRGDLVDAREASVSAQLGAARFALGASVGQQQSAGVREGFGQVAATWLLQPNLSLEASAGRFAANPVAATLGGRFLSAGLSFAIGRGPAMGPAIRLPKARGVAGPREGTTRLTITAPRATRVEVGGDWNGWRPIAARRADDGVWYADVPLPKGRHRFAFRVDGGRWTAPDGAPAEDDEFGGTVAWIEVR